MRRGGVKAIKEEEKALENGSVWKWPTLGHCMAEADTLLMELKMWRDI